MNSPRREPTLFAITVLPPAGSRPPADALPASRLRLLARGLVQGVGFRPFVHRLAMELGLAGHVRNSPAGAHVEVEGPRPALELFRSRLATEPPPPCRILQLEESWLDPTGAADFRIVTTDLAGTRTALVLPDLATCDACRREIFDPANRRFRHPFANCTHCGPRYSVILALPYDRERTTLRDFPLCPACRREFTDPADRRFHAQPIACPECGPQLALWTPDGTVRAVRDAALRAAGEALRAGSIVALKGLGGFQLLVRADDAHAVLRLRQRKQREAKPFALLCPSLDDVRELAEISEPEARLLASSSAPIVLLERRRDAIGRVAEAVAPGNPRLGVMLPYTPLHHLLLADLGFPLVATSGNRSEEPICTDEREALATLGPIADLLLVHDRPIARPVDDSVARVVLGHEQVLRRARGYAPLPLPLRSPETSSPGPSPGPDLLAVGGHLKNSIAVARGPEVFVSQHIGDLETAASATAFARIVADLPALLDVRIAAVAVDPHPDYFPTQHAVATGLPLVPVQHHEAHAWACLLDNDLAPPVLALSWDGTGLGTDRTIWGGEFLELTDHDCRRRAWLRPFPLPGGDAAARDPRRSALGLLHEAGLADTPTARAWIDRHFAETERRHFAALLQRPALLPRTSSLGRLFDGVAALLDLRLASRFEGEAAMQVEWTAMLPDSSRLATTDFGSEERFPLVPVPPPASDPTARGAEPAGAWIVDWAPWLADLLGADPDRPGRAAHLARELHEALAAAALAVARRVGQPRVLLTGGCFQNRLLTERVAAVLRAGGFSVYAHQRLPPNDGGLAAGQAAAARHQLARAAHPPVREVVS